MTTNFGVPLSIADSQRWANACLEQGSALSQLLIPQLAEFDFARALVASAVFTKPVDFSKSAQIDSVKANSVAREYFRSITRSRKSLLVVEDDLARRGDSSLIGEFAFVGDHVVRWRQLDKDEDASIRLLRQGSSGFPTVAFVVTGLAEDFGLLAGASFDFAGEEKLAKSADAMIFAAFDAEAFLVMTRRR
jgi:hypothetical protein